MINFMVFRNEYLVVIDQSESEPFKLACKTPIDFVKVLETDRDIKISDNKLTFRENRQLDISIEAGEVSGQQQRFFKVELVYEGDGGDIDDFAEVVRAFKKIAKKIGEVETLKDDISEYYCIESYPLIFRIENLMRKLINYFMLTRVGTKYINESSPSEVQKTINSSKKNDRADERLHKLDFIHLGDFLFKPAQPKPVQALYEIIGNAKSKNDLELESLREFLPSSNWDRYFSKFMDCDDSYIESRWRELYQFRNMVAHNTILGRTDLERIRKLTNEVTLKLEEAIRTIPKINVPEADKERIHEQVVFNTNELLGEFILAWQRFEGAVVQTALEYFDGDENMLANLKHRNIRQYLEILREEDAVSNQWIDNAEYVLAHRNRLVHFADVDFLDAENLLLTQSLLQLLHQLTSMLLSRDDVLIWKDKIVTVLQSIQGEGSLEEIYDKILDTAQESLSPNWRISVIKTLQSYSSDTSHFEGKDDLFEQIGPRRWALRENPDRVKGV